MLSAISSIIGKTIDIFLKVNSSEARRRKFAKQMFDVYKSLDEVIEAINGIQMVVKDISQQDKKKNFDLFHNPRLPDYIHIRTWSSEGTISYTTLYLDDQGSEHITIEHVIDQKQLLPVLLSNEIRMLNKAFIKIAQIMEAESWELFRARNEPKKLKALSIYDEELANTFVHAWFMDGGFIEALMGLGIEQEIDGKILKLRDAEFGTPQTAVYGYEVVPDETIYDLRIPEQVESFLTFSQSCNASVERARDSVKKFIKENCTIEEIL